MLAFVNWGLSIGREQGMIKAIGECVEQFAGEAVAKKVMEGSERITGKTGKTEIAELVKGAMERMDALLDEDTRVQIMMNCGYNCAEVNKRVIEQAKARSKKCKSINEFLEAEVQKPMSGTRLVREGNTLYQYYTPKTFAKSLRCYCGLLRGLPADEMISMTYCNCSKGFVKKLWESVLEKPVEVEIIQSAVSGAEECEFAIHL
jgi:predicted hydrocarbon binding protein